jgi:class 3 adenylate cyclase
MALKDEITTEVKKIFAAKWETRDGTKVPEAEDVQMGNEAVEIDGTILYADLNGSTAMVDAKKKSFAAEIYKTYLFAAAKVIRAEGGVIVSYDGDRVMAVFIGDLKNTSAVRCALKINWAVKNIVMPLKNAQYPDDKFVVRHTVGVDTCKLWAARTGVRGANDLVWVGPAANYAAKLTELDSTYPTWITHRVYDKMSDEVKIYSDKNMWEPRTWTEMNNLAIYRSNYSWVIN